MSLVSRISVLEQRTRKRSDPADPGVIAWTAEGFERDADGRPARLVLGGCYIDIAERNLKGWLAHAEDEGEAEFLYRVERLIAEGGTGPAGHETILRSARADALAERHFCADDRLVVAFWGAHGFEFDEAGRPLRLVPGMCLFRLRGHAWAGPIVRKLGEPEDAFLARVEHELGGPAWQPAPSRNSRVSIPRVVITLQAARK
jgi:hypothetical protein